MAFLTRHHPAMISKFQLGLYVKMCLGLDVKPQQAQVCPCGALLDANLGHTLGCRKWAGRSWHAAHDGVVTAVKELAQRAGLRASDSHSLLRRDYRHPNSGEMADVFIDGGGHLSVTDAALQFGIQHLKFMADVTSLCIVLTNGTREGHLNADCTWSSTGLKTREKHKFQKHEAAYAVQILGFLSLLCPRLDFLDQPSYDSSPSLLLPKSRHLLITAHTSASLPSALTSSFASKHSIWLACLPGLVLPLQKEQSCALWGSRSLRLCLHLHGAAQLNNSSLLTTLVLSLVFSPVNPVDAARTELLHQPS